MDGLFNALKAGKIRSIQHNCQLVLTWVTAKAGLPRQGGLLLD